MRRIARTLAIGALMTGVATAGMAAPAAATEYKEDRVKYWEDKTGGKCVKKEYGYGKKHVKLHDLKYPYEWEVLVLKGHKDYKAKVIWEPEEGEKYGLKGYPIKWSIACYDYVHKDKDDKDDKDHDDKDDDHKDDDDKDDDDKDKDYGYKA